MRSACLCTCPMLALGVESCELWLWCLPEVTLPNCCGAGRWICFLITTLEQGGRWFFLLFLGLKHICSLARNYLQCQNHKQQNSRLIYLSGSQLIPSGTPRIQTVTICLWSRSSKHLHSFFWTLMLDFLYLVSWNVILMPQVNLNLLMPNAPLLHTIFLQMVPRIMTWI